VLKRRTKELVEEIKETIEKPVDPPKSIRFDKVLSTGSTLLDLAISGGRVHGGGIPGGILAEISGPPGCGKTAILAETVGDAQRKGGDVHVDDPEGRLEREYVEIYGVELTKENYSRSNTVTEMFRGIFHWSSNPTMKGAICVRAEDSLAALSTEMEMGSDEGDKRGQRRAKEFSEGLRKTCRLIADNKWLILCTNQIRSGDTGGTITPGGFGIPFYSSLRIQMNQTYPSWRIEKVINVGKKDIKKVLGVRSTCKIIKSTIDDPFRECVVSIVFGYGIDSIRDELQYYKDMTNETRYSVSGKEFQSLEKAILYIEENNLQMEIKNKITSLWYEIDNKFKTNRRIKLRT